MQFSFGRNWKEFSEIALNDERVEQARESFKTLLEGIDFKTFLDIGFGQGLALFLAQELGAQVRGIDVDSENLKSLNATAQFFKSSSMPRADIISVLDEENLNKKLGFQKYDVVHSWGVFHHTGQMYKAIQIASKLVKPDGYFIFSIYNKHWSSIFWLWIKWFYNKMPNLIQKSMISFFYPIIYFLKWVYTFEDPKKKSRGMDFYYDVVDWVGGYPYEYENIDVIVQYMERLNFRCLRINPAQTPLGCNEYILQFGLND